MATNNIVNTPLSGQTGTGSFVGSTSPTITTPVIATIKDTNAVTILNFSATASAVNYVDVSNAATGNAPIIAAAGTDPNISLTINSKGTSGVPVKGVSTNTVAAAGYVGEYISSTVASGSAISLTTNTAATVTSISLTAGDWDVWGVTAFITATTTNYTNLRSTLSPTTNTLGTDPFGIDTTYPGFSFSTAGVVPGANTIAFGISPGRILLSATTTIYLVAQSTFTVSTMAAYGFIAARRRR